MAVNITTTNLDPETLVGPVDSLPLGGGFLYDGGKLYIRTSATRTLCPINGAENNVSEFAGMNLPLRSVNYQHTAALA
jgi:hypothetical protein